MPPDFEKLIKENSGRIYRIAQRYADGDNIEDLFQDILMQLWRSYKSYRSDAKIETWLYRVAFNTAITGVRKNIKYRDLKTEMAKRATARVAVPAGISQADLLAGFLEQLNDIDASILMMYLDGLSAAGMSDVLGISANLVNVRISRMKAKFSETYIS